MLGVNESTIHKYGAVSEQTAEEMAIAIFLPVARFKKGSPY